KARWVSWAGAWGGGEWEGGAGTALGRAAIFTHNNATSLCASAAISRAAILCSRSNCTARYPELPTTCWLVNTRPLPSTKKPVPWPVSLFTVTTVFFSRLKYLLRSPPELSPAGLDAGAEVSSILALSLVRSTFCSAPASVTGTLQEKCWPPNSAGFGVAIVYLPGGRLISAVPSSPVFTSAELAPCLNETRRKGTGFWLSSRSTRTTRM